MYDYRPYISKKGYSINREQQLYDKQQSNRYEVDISYNQQRRYEGIAYNPQPPPISYEYGSKGKTTTYGDKK